MGILESIKSYLDNKKLIADAQNLSARLEAFRDKEAVAGKTPLDVEGEQKPWPNLEYLIENKQLPEVQASELTADALRSAMASAGMLIVRDLVSSQECKRYRNNIDQVLEARDSYAVIEDGSSVSATEFNNAPENLASIMSADTLSASRHFQRNTGSAMCVESSSFALELLSVYEAKGLKKIIGDYLEDEPCVSAKKWMLRRSKLPVNPAGWHQDGAFMGGDINSINMWLPLSRCGGDSGAPGLDIVPHRFKSTVETGVDGAAFFWSVPNSSSALNMPERMPISPIFNEGDALFFDHFCLHRTQYLDSFTDLRYAVETWFFASSNFPENQFPLSW